MRNPRLWALRTRAQAVLDERVPGGADLLHEMEVLHTELAVQNEHLQRAEREATEVAADYRQLFLNVPVALVVLDASLRIRDTNARARTMLGTGAVRRTHFEELLGSSDRTSWRALAARMSNAADSERSAIDAPTFELPEVSLRRAGGERTPCRIAAHPHGENWVVTLEDLAPLRLAESQRQRADARLAQVLRSSSDGVVFVELRSFSIVEANSAFLAQVGLDALAASGLALWEVFAMPQRPYQELRVKQLLATGGGQATLALCGAGGAIVHVAATIAVLDGPDQLGSLVLRDVTQETALDEERAALREARERSERIESLGHLATGIAHDMNNVLAAVLGCAAEDGSVAELRAALAEIRTAATRGRAVTKRLMAFARREPLHSVPFDLKHVVVELGALLSRTLPKNISVEVHTEPTQFVIAGDEPEWQQALLNLAFNARDAMPQGGVLRFSLTSVGSGGRLVVEDTGAGMTPAVRAHAFEPFFTTKARGNGTGLGLAHVHAVARAHAVGLACDSAPGLGTTFTFDFPHLFAAPLSPRDPSGPPPPREAGRVLLVDDDELARRGTARVLRRLGFEVREGESGVAALAALGRTGFDLVVTDLAMPEMDGITLLKQVRASWPTVPTLLISGHAGAALESSPADVALAKPFTPLELRDAIVQARARRQA